jgi:CarboxypepD_reg-like domain
MNLKESLKYFIPICVLVFFNSAIYAQKQISGTILNRITTLPIQFASVGLMIQNTGVYTDEKGNFSIAAVKHINNDTLIISFVGFKTVLIPTSTFINNSTIKLEAKENILNEVVITSRQKKEIQKLNNFNNCSLNHFYLSDEKEIMIAQLFEAPETGMLISEIEICKTKGSNIFRVHIFDYDSVKQCPSIELSDSLIELNSKKSKVKFDLNTYNIIIPQKRFFIAFEWLKIPANIFTKKIKIAGAKQKVTFYEPAIGFRYTNENIGAKKLWVSTFNGKWKVLELNDNMNLLISAKLK